MDRRGDSDSSGAGRVVATVKRISVSLFFAAVLASASGCRKEEPFEYDAVQLDFIHFSKTERFGESPFSAVANGALYIPLDKDLRAFAEDNISRVWHCGFHADFKPNSGFRDVVDEFFSAFKQNQAQYAAKKAAGEEDPLNAGWDLNLNSEITWDSAKYFSCRASAFTYFGGAHPDCWYWNGTYSRSLGRRIAVSDLIDRKNYLSVANIIRFFIARNPETSDYIRSHMTNEVASTYEEYAGEDGRGDGCNPCLTENFMIVANGIVWTYNEYELSGYFDGNTDVLVPWEALARYLKSPDLIDEPDSEGNFMSALRAAEEEGATEDVGGLKFF